MREVRTERLSVPVWMVALIAGFLATCITYAFMAGAKVNDIAILKNQVETMQIDITLLKVESAKQSAKLDLLLQLQQEQRSSR